MHWLLVVGQNDVDFVADVLWVDGWPLGKTPDVAKVCELLTDACERCNLRRVFVAELVEELGKNAKLCR